ncbi:MAG: hypothetical protein CTY31_02470 [Hyphomicrobium sp.]|nr:MAG: hypothetical protein CTY39_06625 [Hyphomicrobium sp.]PPD01635.1 MAG: hypothetical protein CTY31_02470 [Hyphomicrobium sp.]
MTDRTTLGGSTEQCQTGAKADRFRERHYFVRPALDAIGALVVFTLVSAIIVSHPSAASPHTVGTVMVETTHATLIQNAVVNEDDNAPVVQIATTSSSKNSNAVFRRTSTDAAWGLLAVAFSILAALNLAIFRHLRRVYAVPSQSRINRQFMNKVSIS